MMRIHKMKNTGSKDMDTINAAPIHLNRIFKIDPNGMSTSTITTGWPAEAVGRAGTRIAR